MAELCADLNLLESSVPESNPAVSIGMPVYNGAKYIREALDSLLAQTYTDFELIISDNCSIDATQEICEAYARRDSRIRYVRQDGNKGAAENFRFVLDCAKADLFMWAAYDDLWGPNYLMDATTLLVDKNIDFVFPAFELRSINLGVSRKFAQDRFKFVESEDRRWRVLHFMALHYLSHSANIVYSLFRTRFVRAAWMKQDISNDGALGAAILGLGRGAISNAIFSKRYRMLWPGMLPPILSVAKGWLHQRRVTDESMKAIQAARFRMLSLFPEYEREIAFIFERYRPHIHDRDYRVCSIRKLF